MEESVGIFLRIENDSEQKFYSKMIDLTTKENFDLET
jgi:hypothetical protein